MTPLEIYFWLLAGCVLYPYVLYPVWLTLIARLRPRPTCPRGPLPTSFSVVVAAHNEAGVIERRLRELTRFVAASSLKGEILVVSDGSTDDTAFLARRFATAGVRVLELPEQQGKAVALSRGCELASHDIIIFADVRQTWDPAALERLLQNFADPQVGAVSGDLVLESKPGVLAGVGMYWRYEKWLRKQESRIHSTIGVTGAISAVRRRLFHGLPAGTLLDDVYWPLRVVMQGYRVVHDETARAYDRLPDRPQDEFRRKVRTLSGNFQLAVRLPSALLPWRNPICFQFLSHKLMRLVVPWALLGMLALSLALPGELYRFLFWAQVGGYALGIDGLCQRTGPRFRLAEAAGSFLILNSAAWVAFWVWVSGHARTSWHKAAYPSLPVRYS